jgi:hypothetical protein
VSLSAVERRVPCPPRVAKTFSIGHSDAIDVGRWHTRGIGSYTHLSDDAAIAGTVLLRDMYGLYRAKDGTCAVTDVNLVKAADWVTDGTCGEDLGGDYPASDLDTVGRRRCGTVGRSGGGTVGRSRGGTASDCNCRDGTYGNATIINTAPTATTIPTGIRGRTTVVN